MVKFSNNDANLFSKFLKYDSYFLILAFAIAIIIIKIIISFSSTNFYNYDAVGHYLSSWVIREHLFPSMIGWNPFLYSGFPANQFYPALFHYLAALLSYSMPLTDALKLLISLSLILTPISLYYFLRKSSFSQVKASIVTLAMTSFLFLNDSTFKQRGVVCATFHSTISTGTLAEGFALPFIFFYLGMLNEKKAKIIPLTLLMSAIVLSHVFGILVASSAFIAVFFFSDKEKQKTLIHHALLTLLLCAFFVLPFIFKYSFTTAAYVKLIPDTISFYSLIATLALILYFSLKNKEVEFFPVITLFFMLTIMTLLIEVLKLSIHPLRLLPFLYILAIAIFFKTLDKKMVYFISLVFCIIFLIFFNPFHFKAPNSIEIPDFGKLNSRFMVFAYGYDQPSVQTLEHIIPMKTGNFGMKGTYIESSLHGRIVTDIQKLVNKNVYVFGTPWDSGAIEKASSENKTIILDKFFDAFNINYIITESEPLVKYTEKRYVFSYKSANYSLYKVGNSSLVEAIEMPVYPNVSDDILKEVRFILGNYSYKKIGVPITILEQSESQDYVKFAIDSPKDVLVLVKISYFPNWQAYSVDKEIPIIKSPTNHMILKAKGVVELRYQNIWIDYIGNALSVVGIIVMLALIVFSFRNKP